MDATVRRESAGRWRRAAVVVGALLGLAIGLFGSIFGPYYVGAVGLFLAALGFVDAKRPWARFVLVVGLAIVAGACVYVLLGILTPDGAGSGSGSGVGD
ncbi:hypothetical protein L2X99_04560 [Microbacterium sp. KUDC0406]|uniref:hypothetical protein n=1 Tax=Microbacterium sp. KUDC0406 TaxID=2909588 RepID=UPI001F2ADB19|nr:hypothetical protein [Microbacterium sp. KUDC0406]UJP10899.1 hypothetical protein L2X99_04560 [Microbacterium sp. KUDC0406]